MPETTSEAPTQEPDLIAYADHRPPYTSERHGHDDIVLSWEASEYVMHHKPASWFVGFGVVAVLLSGLLFLVTRDIFSVVVLILMAAAVLIYAVRKPHTLQYSLSDKTIVVGHKEYQLSEFRSFSIIHDGSLYSVNLLPTKRFAPPLSIYFDEKDLGNIMEILTRHLPHVERELDPIDRISRYLRF